MDSTDSPVVRRALELAALLEDGTGPETMRLLLALRGLGPDPGAPPRTFRISSDGSGVGVWDIVATPSGSGLRRRHDFSPYELAVWADEEETGGKGDAERVVVMGESSARGYLLDPVFTPTRHLQALLDRSPTASEEGRRFQCVDLARTSADIYDLRRVIAALPHLEPDHLVVYAGNNWSISCYRPDVMSSLGARTRSDGYRGLADEFVERVLMPEVEKFLAELRALADQVGTQIVIVVPEFNLTGWSPTAGGDRIEVPALAAGPMRRWYSLLDDAVEADRQARWPDVVAAVTEMSKLDEGLSPVPDHLLGRALAASGDHGLAREAYERSRDSIHALILKNLPRTPAVVQDRLVTAGRAAGFTCVDLRTVLVRTDAPQLPDEDHFLDYCHLSDTGVDLAMSAVADRILGRADGAAPAPPTPTIDGRDRAVSLVLAAIYNSYCGQPVEVVRRYLDRALAADAGVRGLLSSLNGMLARPGPAWTSRDFVELVREPNMAHLLVPLAETRPRGSRMWSLREALAAHGLAPLETAELIEDHGSRELVDVGQSPLGVGKVPNYTPSRCYLQATTRRTDLSFVVAGSSSLRLRLVHRTRHPVAEHAVIEVNGRVIGHLPPSRGWCTSEFPVPGDAVVDGVNALVVAWGMPEIDVHAQVAADADAMDRREFPQILPVFGELFSVLVDVERGPS